MPILHEINKMLQHTCTEYLSQDETTNPLNVYMQTYETTNPIKHTSDIPSDNQRIARYMVRQIANHYFNDKM